MAGTLTISTLSDGTNSTSSTNCIQGSAKAWVNFNGSTAAIRASYNVSSITKNGTGDYNVNFTNAMTDGNYTLAGAVFWEAGIPSGFIGVGGTVPQTTYCKVITLTNNSDTTRDFTQVYAVFNR